MLIIEPQIKTIQAILIDTGDDGIFILGVIEFVFDMAVTIPGL